MVETLTNGSPVNGLATRREWPRWYRRGKIKMVLPDGTVAPNAFAYADEVVEISPRFLKNGQTYRIRPVNPSRFFAAWCHENHILPTLLTPEECRQEEFLTILDTLWARYKHAFDGLASPFAASDYGTTPNHRIGFSYVIPQQLVVELDYVRPLGTPRNWTRSSPPVPGSISEMVGLNQQINALRARNAAASGAPLSSLPPDKQKELDELDDMMVAVDLSTADTLSPEAPPVNDVPTAAEPAPVSEAPVAAEPAPAPEPLADKPAANGKKHRR